MNYITLIVGAAPRRVPHKMHTAVAVVLCSVQAVHAHAGCGTAATALAPPPSPGTAAGALPPGALGAAAAGAALLRNVASAPARDLWHRWHDELASLLSASQVQQRHSGGSVESSSVAAAAPLLAVAAVADGDADSKGRRAAQSAARRWSIARAARGATTSTRCSSAGPTAPSAMSTAALLVARSASSRACLIAGVAEISDAPPVRRYSSPTQRAAQARYLQHTCNMWMPRTRTKSVFEPFINLGIRAIEEGTLVDDDDDYYDDGDDDDQMTMMMMMTMLLMMKTIAHDGGGGGGGRRRRRVG